MLQEAIDLQQRAVSKLFTLSEKTNHPLTFKAPTGSGKTRMMADFMNKVLSLHDDVVFLVSSLSKGDLAEQNYESFEKCKEDGTFPYLKPYLINTEVSGEENLFIPTDYNVYVLPRDLFKKGGKLMQGVMLNFLNTMTAYYLGEGLNKRIYLIKDECHIETRNLDSISEKYFTKTFNFSATPQLRRGQIPDVEISDAEAVQAKLIKRVEYGNDEDSLEDAICKFEEIKKKYISLGVNPCLIIQISNKDKAEEEWNRRIKPILEKAEHQSLKWMVIVDKKTDLCDTNDAIKKKLPVNQWKKYAKGNASTIDVIVFKMVISEGWDIPRACMLYQVRDTQSKQLDEQVMGRVRRNPRLKDYETLSDEEKELATTAWIWGIKPESANKQHEVRLFADGKYVAENIRLQTIKLQNLTEKNDFDLNSFIANKKDEITHENIFTLYQKLKQNNELQIMCYQYAENDVNKWMKFMESFDDIKKHYKSYVCDYDKSMVVDKEVSFPISSFYVDNGNNNEIDNWVWCRKDDQSSYSFDSEAERRWASLLQKLNRRYGTEIELEDDMEDEKYLWGKNFPYNSEIKYEYYNEGIHASYPDFVMKDTRGIIHVFEVKSVNVSSSSNMNGEEYKDKIRHLEDCYLVCSRKLHNIYFYLPILKGDNWQIIRFRKGEKDIINERDFRESLKG